MSPYGCDMALLRLANHPAGLTLKRASQTTLQLWLQGTAIGRRPVDRQDKAGGLNELSVDAHQKGSSRFRG